MTRELRLYLLAVVLPAVVLAAGGIRLVALECGRARTAVRENLDAKAGEIAQDIVAALGGTRLTRPPRPPHRPPHRPPLRNRGRDGEDAVATHVRSVPPAGGRQCRRHELPPDVRKVLEEKLADVAEGYGVAAEVRHACGCMVIGAPIAGKLTGRADLAPVLPDYAVVTAPLGGDAAAAGDIRIHAAIAAILLFLMTGTFVAGTALLVRSARKARDEARRQTDFLSNVSHELKTPLTSITMFAEMLAGDAIDASAREKAQGIVRKEARRLAGLVDTLLDFARLERGVAKLAAEPIDLAAIARDAAEAQGVLGGQPPVLCEGPAAKAIGDAGAVRRILDCLLENAAKYAPGAEIGIRVAEGRIEVADSGPGIPPSDAKHIFERFWRGDNSVTRTVGGTGLGLAIARGLARGMGGDLTFRPNSPHGAIFVLELPTGEGKEPDFTG